MLKKQGVGLDDMWQMTESYSIGNPTYHFWYLGMFSFQKNHMRIRAQNDTDIRPGWRTKIYTYTIHSPQIPHCLGPHNPLHLDTFL